MHSLLLVLVHAAPRSSALGAQQICSLHDLTELPSHASQVSFIYVPNVRIGVVPPAVLLDSDESFIIRQSTSTARSIGAALRMARIFETAVTTGLQRLLRSRGSWNVVAACRGDRCK